VAHRHNSQSSQLIKPRTPLKIRGMKGAFAAPSLGTTFRNLLSAILPRDHGRDVRTRQDRRCCALVTHFRVAGNRRPIRKTLGSSPKLHCVRLYLVRHFAYQVPMNLTLSPERRFHCRRWIKSLTLAFAAANCQILWSINKGARITK
jgi:hypothetical protein